MGMTFEQADKTLIELYHYFHGDVHFCGYNEEDVSSAIEVARDTMRKYQRIAQIVEGWSADPELDSADSMADIEGVIDGSN